MFALGAAVIACGAEGDGEAAGDDAMIGADGFPVGPDGKPIPTKLEGQFELGTMIDLTTSPVLPATVADTLTALSRFKDKPAQTLVDLMEVANVPAATFLNAIPGPVRPMVLGFIDDYVFKAVYDTVPVTKRITALLDDVGSIATNFELVTRLDLPAGDAFGKAKAKHSVHGVAYAWDGKRHLIEVPQDIRAKVSAEQSIDANAVPLAPRSKDLELGRLQLSEHTFGVPVGTFAVKALDLLATARFGADLRGSLGKVIDCDKLADTVSKRCIDPLGPGKVCVDNKAAIMKICTTGIDLFVNSITSTLKGLDIGIDLTVGTAQMWDPPAPNGALDGNVDRLDLGYWSGAIKANNEEAPFLATFTGRRVGGGAPAAPTKEPTR